MATQAALIPEFCDPIAGEVILRIERVTIDYGRREIRGKAGEVDGCAGERKTGGRAEDLRSGWSCRPTGKLVDITRNVVGDIRALQCEASNKRRVAPTVQSNCLFHAVVANTEAAADDEALVI